MTLGFGAPKIDDSRKHVVHLSHNSYAYVELDPGFYQLSFSVDDPQKIFMPIHPMRYVKIDENKTYFYRYQAFVNRDKYMVLWHTVQMDEMRDLPEIKFQIMNGKNLSQGQANFD